MTQARNLHAFAITLLLAVQTPFAMATERSSLVDASVQQLEEMQADAEREQEALRQLVEGVSGGGEESQNKASKAVTGEGESNETRAAAEMAAALRLKHNVTRDGEASVARVLPVREDGETRSAFQNVMRTIAEHQDPGRAIQQLQAFVTRYTGHRDARVALAHHQMLAENPTAALAVLAPLTTPAYKRTHPDWQAWFWAGSAHLALGNLSKARELLEISLTKQSDRAEVWVQLAVVEQELNSHPAALQYLDIAARLAPRLGEVHLNRAYSYEHLGKIAEAMRAYQAYLVSDVAEGDAATRPIIMRRLALLAANKV